MSISCAFIFFISIFIASAARENEHKNNSRGIQMVFVITIFAFILILRGFAGSPVLIRFECRLADGGSSTRPSAPAMSNRTDPMTAPCSQPAWATTVRRILRFAWIVRVPPGICATSAPALHTSSGSLRAMPGVRQSNRASLTAQRVWNRDIAANPRWCCGRRRE